MYMQATTLKQRLTLHVYFLNVAKSHNIVSPTYNSLAPFTILTKRYRCNDTQALYLGWGLHKYSLDILEAVTPRISLFFTKVFLLFWNSTFFMINGGARTNNIVFHQCKIGIRI